MITFFISLAALVVGYLVYGSFVERVFSPDDRPTPAVAKADGMDYVAMPYWKVFMIQFLNIAGTGPIFGAIMGAKFGPAAYLWIVFGCIFAGAVHDYFTGMLSMRNGGCDLPELVRKYLGGGASKVLLARRIPACHARYCVCLLSGRDSAWHMGLHYAVDSAHLCLLRRGHHVAY